MVATKIKSKWARSVKYGSPDALKLSDNRPTQAGDIRPKHYIMAKIFSQS